MLRGLTRCQAQQLAFLETFLTPSALDGKREPRCRVGQRPRAARRPELALGLPAAPPFGLMGTGGSLQDWLPRRSDPALIRKARRARAFTPQRTGDTAFPLMAAPPHAGAMGGLSGCWPKGTTAN